MGLLDQIDNPNDVKKIPEGQLKELASEIRSYLLEITSKNGGHLASNLGIVEITLAIHRQLDFPKDKLIFDVGHQSYVHKILTGRKNAMKTLRQFEGISGFPDIAESDCDSFVAGHASNALSAALGLAKARELKGTDEKIVVVLGDGSLTGGMTTEALNNCANLNSNVTIILNDNERSISANVGGLANYLGSIRTSQKYRNIKTTITSALNKIPMLGEYLISGIHTTKESIKRFLVPGVLFEELGLTYIGPIDGHNLEQMKQALESAERFDGPVIIHALTEKGRGYKPAVAHPAQFHGVEPFDIETGELLDKNKSVSYTSLFSKKLLEIASENQDVVAVTAAMPFGTGLYNFSKSYPDRFFDVGIAEAHAVTFAAGLAANGKVPVVAIYSTFLQRAFDQIINDVCLPNLHVVFAIDRAGIVGNDGKTHQGIFDESFLSLIPNMTIMNPKNAQEMEGMLEFAVNEMDGPVAIRYPRGTCYTGLSNYRQPIKLNTDEIIEKGKDIAILATGTMVEVVETVVKDLKEQGYNPTFVNVRFLNNIDESLIKELAIDHDLFVTVEESVYTGSYGQRLAAFFNTNGINKEVLPIALPNEFIPHGSIQELRNKLGMSAEKIIKRILDNKRATD